MLTHRYLDKEDVLVITPTERLNADDFIELQTQVSRLLDKRRQLRGLMIYSKHFPGWASWSGFRAHAKFVRDHHNLVARIALVTDTPLAFIVPRVISAFIAARVQRFSYDDYDKALEWLAKE